MRQYPKLTFVINCHVLIEQLEKAHFENRLPDRLNTLGKYKLLIIDEIGYLPMDIQGTNLFFQLIARWYEKVSTIFTSNKTFSQWNEVFADMTIASVIFDRVLHHCTVINIKGERYRHKERKEFMKKTADCEHVIPTGIALKTASSPAANLFFHIGVDNSING